MDIAMSFQEYFDAGQQNGGPRYQTPRHGNSMATAAMVVGIMAVCFTFICPMTLTFILAPLGIILALLSKGFDAGLSGNAKVGLIASLCGAGVNLMMLVGMIGLFFGNAEYRRAFLDTYNQTFEAVYGTDFNDVLKDMYGDDFDLNEFFNLPPQEGSQALPQGGKANEPEISESSAPPYEKQSSAASGLPDTDKNYVTAEPNNITNFEHSLYPLD